MVAVPLASKNTTDLTHALSEAVLELEHVWRIPLVKRVHTDKEKAALSEQFQHEWAQRAIMITTTVGHDPQANGLAEVYVRIIKEGARTRVCRYVDRATRPRLWPFAMSDAALHNSFKHATKSARISKKDVLPFGSKIMAIPPGDGVQGPGREA